jgi:hypothetical protein
MSSATLRPHRPDHDESTQPGPVVTQPMPSPVPTGVEPAVGPAAEVREFQATCASREPAQLGLDHQYTSECLRMLVVALERSVPQQRLTALQAEIDRARDAARRMADSRLKP